MNSYNLNWFRGQYIYLRKTQQTCYDGVMVRIARVIITGGYPHHITQRGNRRRKTFFCDEEYLT
ncbi:MAG: hypothetical protein ABR512_08245, partial [Desulfopila sp.]